jgi:hypothetical protein
LWKKLLNHSNIIAKHWVACVSIYFNKCKIQLVNNGFNILKVNGLTHVHKLIIEEMWKKSLICSNINVKSYLVTCVLINYGKYKMQLTSNGFNMLKSWWLNSNAMLIIEEMSKKLLTYYNV